MHYISIALELNTFRKKTKSSQQTETSQIFIEYTTMFAYFCIGFIDFMLKDKILLVYINLFYSNDYEKNDKLILKYF